MSLFIDRPIWPGYGRHWAHLISAAGFEHLHEVAAGLSIPRRAFDRDHYDVPEHRWLEIVEFGAVVVSSREIVRILSAAGLRRPKGRLLRPEHPPPGFGRTG